MTRATIDFGIDLGTTNSSIAVLVDGRPQPLRNNEQQEITPSAVMADRNGAISVGQRAYRMSELRPGSVAREFKRAMGTERTFSISGRTMSPEELSAEVLKTLRSDVQRLLGEDLRAAVITVPAMFTITACDATIRAARLAGIEESPLLQEPIAAGLAYGYNQTSVQGYWLVYDLGGGTFDTSLMTVRDGRLQVLDHAGDEMLGGKNFDDALLDYVVDQLREDYSIEGLVRRGDPTHRDLYARLKLACEDARIRLSHSESVIVDIAGVSDDAGNPIDTYLDVSRSAYESLTDSLVSRTTEIVNDLLTRNRLSSVMVERIVMVGGPTLTPLVRSLVRRDTGIEVETRSDPMTVVAQGAAIYAGSVLRAQNSSKSFHVPRVSIQVLLRYNPVSDDTEAPVGGRFNGADRSGLAVQLDRSDGGWASGRVPVTNGTFVTKVSLSPSQVNTFRLRLFDGTGAELEVDPNQFVIRHGLSVDDPPLSRSLGVAVDDGSGEAATLCLLKHGTRLPATQKYTLWTIRPVYPGRPDGINVHVVEGESRRADRNDHVGHIRLDGTNIPRTLPAGSEIEIKFSVDTSRRISVEAFVPLVDETYKLSIQDVNRSIPDVAVLEHQLRIEQQRLEEISQVSSTAGPSSKAEEVNRALEEARCGDEEAAVKAQRFLHELQTGVDDIKVVADLPLLRSEWYELLPKAESLIAEYGEPSVKQRLPVLRREGEEAMAEGNQVRLRQRIDQLNQVYLSTMFAQDGWWIGFYQHLVERQGDMSDSATAGLLVQEARRALDRQDFEMLRRTCWRLWELLPNTTREGGLPDVGVRA